MIFTPPHPLHFSLIAESFKNRRVLITGGAGFIGSWMCETLLSLGARVICLDNLASGREQNIAHLLDHEGFSFTCHDISVPISFEEPIDYVMHLASRASPMEFDKFPIEILKANTMGTLNALEIARKHNARLLFTSTSEVYGDAAIIPTPETYRGNVNTLGIRGCYDEAKRAGEAFCMAYLRQHSMDVRIARIFNTYGLRMRGDGHYGRVIPRFIDQALHNRPITIFGDGQQTRSFCHITDLIHGLLRLAGMDNLSGEVVNLGNPEEITIQGLAETVLLLTGSKSAFEYHPLPTDDPERRCPDITKATRVTGWRPTVDLNMGLKRTIEDMARDNP